MKKIIAAQIMLVTIFFGGASADAPDEGAAAFDAGNYAEALTSFQQRAEQGDANATVQSGGHVR